MQFTSDTRALADTLFQTQFKLLRDLAETVVIDCQQYENEQSRDDRPEPPRVPPRRQNLDSECGAGLAPGTATGGALHPKFIHTCGERRIACEALLAAHFMP